MTRYHLTYMMPEARREQLCDWMRANNLDPNSIPMASVVQIDGDSLTVEVVARDDDGRVLLDPHEPNQVVRTTRTVPLLAPWPLDPA